MQDSSSNSSTIPVDEAERTRSAPSSGRDVFLSRNIASKRIAPFQVPIVLDNYYSATPPLRCADSNGEASSDAVGNNHEFDKEMDFGEKGRSVSVGILRGSTPTDEAELRPGF